MGNNSANAEVSGMNHEIGRRQFLQGTSAGIALAAAAGACSTAAFAAEDASNAADSAASAAQGAEEDFSVAPDPIDDSMIADTVEADVIVVGAGTSGLCTALSAVQAGGNVIVITASSKPISRGGSNNAVNSKTMEEKGIDPVDIQLMMTKESMANSGRVDQRKWSKYFKSSEESANWLIDIMESAGYETEIEVTSPYPKDSPYYTPAASHGWLSDDNRAVGLTQDFVVTTLADKITEAGGQIFYQTIARQLVRGGVANGTDGRVDAVIAENSDGSYTKYVGTKAIVLATGDFSADRAMMEKYCPQAVELMDPSIADSPVNYDVEFATGGLYKGDGQKMGLWVGAAWQHNVNCAPMYIAGGTATARPYCCHWGLMVNANGERFMNEDCPGSFGSFGVSCQPGKTGYAIWDDAYADGVDDWYASNTAYTSEPMTTEEIKATWSDSYDTLDEAIDALGLPKDATTATIERYNELCEAGSDDDFFKDPAKLQPIATPPFHTGVEQPVLLTVMGGLRTNENMQVCDADDQPIPGLYNVGIMVGDMYGSIYTFMMEGFNYGICRAFGWLTGRYIMENE